MHAAQDYLPPKVHEAFLSTLTEFVLLPWREAMRASLDGASQGGSQVRLLQPLPHDQNSGHPRSRLFPRHRAWTLEQQNIVATHIKQ